ncbi:MAG: YncE family protein [Candidatus Lernaella stagnicola]|nr:YncE family protein [Candidatus Lernaella stagnicola]
MRQTVLLIICLALILAVAPACDNVPDYAGEGGVLDNPIGLAINWPYAYVTNANFDLSDDKVGWISVIDLPTALVERKRAVLRHVETKPYLAKIILNNDKSRAFVADRRSNHVRIFDLSKPGFPEQIDVKPNDEGVQGIEVARQPYGLALTADGKTLLAACIGSGDVSIVDVENRKLIRNVRLAAGITEVKIQPGTNHAYVTNQDLNAITVIEADTGAFLTAFGAFGGFSLFGFDFRGLDFTPDGKSLFVASRSPSAVLMVDTDKLPLQPDRAVLRILPSEDAPIDAEVRPDGLEAWVTNYDDNSIMAYDALTGRLLGAMDTGAGPTDIAFFENPENPGYYYALVANFLSHNLTLLDAMTKEVIWSIP